MKRFFSALLVVSAIIPGSLYGAVTNAVAATLVLFGPDLAANGWQLMTFPRRTPARFTAQGPNTLSISADRAVAVLWRPMRSAEDNAATAQWRWRVDSSVGPADLSRKGGDDRAIAIYFVFSDAVELPKPIDLGNAMQSGQTKILMYVWGGSAPKNSFLPAPYIGEKARTIILKSAYDPIGNWHSERVDLSADYRKAFGMAAPALVALAISSDSDDTSGINTASIADLVVNP